MDYFPRWSLKTESTIMPDERLPSGQTVVLGLQHVVAMFGATVLAPILMGFDPNVAIFFSGVATLIFFIATGGRVPSYLGSSFAFIGPVLAATGATVGQPNPNIGLALGGIVAAGVVYTAIGVVVMVAGHRWVERLMPPAVTGAIVAAIGLVLAPIAIGSASGTGPTDPNGSGFARFVALLTVVAVGAVAVYTPGLWRRLPILIGGAIGYFAYLVLANGMGLGSPIDFSKVGAAAWLGLPNFARPVFTGSAISLIRRRESRAHQGDRRHDRAQPRPAPRPRLPRRRRRDDGVGLVRRHRGHDLRREHGRHGGDADLLDPALRRRSLDRDPPRLLAEVRGADPDHPGAGARRPLDRGVRPHRRNGGADLGREPGRFLRPAQPHHRRGRPRAQRRQLQADARRLHPRRHRHRDLRRHHPLPPSQPGAAPGRHPRAARLGRRRGRVSPTPLPACGERASCRGHEASPKGEGEGAVDGWFYPEAAPHPLGRRPSRPLPARGERRARNPVKEPRVDRASFRRGSSH